MKIEFRQIVSPVQSQRVVRILVNEFKTLLTFEYAPERKDPEPFIFKGLELLEMIGLEKTESFKAYIIGVEPGENGKINYHILENFQNILHVNKHTNFQLFDIIPIIK
jgi:hypothetical protein